MGGAMASLTLMALALCLPQGVESAKGQIIGILALTLSYPAIRTIADGNIEFLILAGLALVEYGLLRKKPVVLGLGILLAAIKVQETWILILFLPLLAGKEWYPRKWLTALGIMAGIGLPTMIWRGRDWLLSIITSLYRGSIMELAVDHRPADGGNTRACVTIVGGYFRDDGIHMLSVHSRLLP